VKKIFSPAAGFRPPQWPPPP